MHDIRLRIYVYYISDAASHDICISRNFGLHSCILLVIEHMEPIRKLHLDYGPGVSDPKNNEQLLSALY